MYYGIYYIYGYNMDTNQRRMHGKSQGGHYFIYKNLDLETGSNRWFGNYIKFGGQESLIIFSGCDSLEDAQASCERHAQNGGEAL